MFRQRGEEYVDPSKAKIEEAIQRKIRDQAERHYRNRETQKGNGSMYFYHIKVCFFMHVLNHSKGIYRSCIRC